ncbi:MAG: hypothetical protein IJ801_01810 [Lachnospiraceae bacterium]|nr:hypothetical protein [Lachnospiraceae bacterium]
MKHNKSVSGYASGFLLFAGMGVFLSGAWNRTVYATGIICGQEITRQVSTQENMATTIPVTAQATVETPESEAAQTTEPVTIQTTTEAATPSTTQAATEMTTPTKEETVTVEIQPENPLNRNTAPILTCNRDIHKKVKLKWKAINGATKYAVYRADSSKGKYKRIGTVTGKSYVDKTAKARRLYYYKVQAMQELQQADGRTSVQKGKMSKKSKVYVRPKKPKMVICGECYVEGIQYYAPELVPSNLKLVSKVGLNTTNLLSYPYYEGKTAIQEVCDLNPDRVYFLVGANEFLNNNPDYTVGNFDKMRKLLQKKNKNVEIILIKISPQGRTGERGNKVAARAQYNKAYQEFAEKHRNVDFCDATDFMDDGFGTLKSSCDAGDGCHWTPVAAKQMVTELKNWSKKELGTW